MHSFQAARSSVIGENSVKQPKCFLIVHSVAKRTNVGQLLRSATAFGVSEVCIIGSRHFSTFGSHGAEDFVALRSFHNLAECCQHLRQAEGCEIVGVEIMDAAVPVQSRPFSGPTAFILGNEGEGLSPAQTRQCSSFVYIPQHGPGTASLNVYVAASIVLHHFATWAGYPERARSGGKFDLGPRPQRTAPRGTVPLTSEEMEAEMLRRRANKEARQESAGGNQDTPLLSFCTKTETAEDGQARLEGTQPHSEAHDQ